MEAESLNIKLKLDLSSVTSGVTKVKKQLNGMAKSVKDSIPHISREGNKASKSLNDVSAASTKAKKSIRDIGKEAKSSLSAVAAESSKMASKLSAINAAKKNGIGFDTQDIADGTSSASDSLEGLQNTMQSLLHLDFIGLLAGSFDTLRGKVSSAINPILSSFKKLVTDSARGAKVVRTYNQMFVEFNNMIAEIGAENLPRLSSGMGDFQKHITQVKKRIKEINADNFKRLNQNVITLTKSIGALAVKVSVALAGLLALAGAKIANSTRDYREEQTKLNAAFTAAGASAKEASQAYNGLFRFLGKSDVAVEAANHLAKMTTNTQALSEWTTICQGIYATFGDSLPIEGLTEAANESIRVSKVTGVLADALNWAGVSEDDLNAALAQTNSLAEREVLLRSTLNGLYQNAAQIYEQNNRRMIEQNEAQARLNNTMARIGQQTQVLVTSWTNLKNVIMSVLSPAIIYVSAVFSVLIDKLAAAIQWLGALVGIKFDSLGSSISGVSAGITGAAGAASGLTDSLNGANSAAEKLKRTTMGFDELNIVSNPNTSSGGSGGSGGGGGGGVSGLETGNGVLGKMGEQIEDVKAKVESFFDKWKTQIAIVGASLGTLSIAKILEQLGKAIGLGDKFVKTMSTIKTLAATAITIVLQYSFVNEYMDNYIDGEGFKEYLKAALVSAIGAGILYSMWGSTGLVIGLGVTAVASIKSVIDNGGITNVQSAAVALTGLGASIGAVATALTATGLNKEIIAFFALLKEGNGFIPTLSAAFPKLSGAISGVASAASGALSAIGGLVGGGVVAGLGVVAAAVASISAVVVFLKRHWEDVTNAVKKFFNENIAPRLNKIAEAWNTIKESIKNALPPEVVEFIQNAFSKIGEILQNIGESIGTLFEWLGAHIFDLISGPIIGSISTLISAIQGFVQVVSGVVQIVSGVVGAIVKLFSGDLKGAWESVKQIGKGIEDVFSGMYNATIGVVVNFVKDIISWFTDLWDELVGHSIVPDMVNAIINWFKKLPSAVLNVIINLVNNVVQKFKDMFTSVKTAVQSGWSTIKSWFSSNVAPKFTASYWLNKFDTIRAGAATKVEAVRNAIQNGWGTIKNWFSNNVAPKFTISYWADKFSAIGSGMRSALNGVISAVERAVNAIVGRINTLHWTVPSWVPILGGKSWGFNFSYVSIPRLAKGGIATSSTIANIGEAGREAVLPLDRNTEWMNTLVDRFAARQQPQKVVLQVGEKELGWATIGAINGITKQTGTLQLTFA